MEYNKDANVKARHNKNTHYIKNMNVLKTIVCLFVFLKNQNMIIGLLQKFDEFSFLICKAELGKTIQVLLVQYVIFGHTCTNSKSYHSIWRWITDNHL